MTRSMYSDGHLKVFITGDYPYSGADLQKLDDIIEAWLEASAEGLKDKIRNEMEGFYNKYNVSVEGTF